MPEPDHEREALPARDDATPLADFAWSDELVGIGFFPDEVALPSGWRFPENGRRP